MRLCFILEEEYKHDPMPLVVADQLLQWGHEVDLLEPQAMLTSLSGMRELGYDAYVLKPIADGPGLSILEAAEAIGLPTINNSRAVRLVRDKAVAAAYAHAHGLPIPPTYFVAHPRLLSQIPADEYPIVVKPSNGSSCRGIYRLDSPADLDALVIAEANDSFFLAQRYEDNPGYDIKVYVTGKEVYALAKKSPLHGNVEEEPIRVTPQLRKLALDIGRIFGLDIYGIDVVESPRGLAVLDINDFPSFSRVPGAARRVAEYVLHAARKAGRHVRRPGGRQLLSADSLTSFAPVPAAPPRPPQDALAFVLSDLKHYYERRIMRMNDHTQPLEPEPAGYHGYPSKIML